MAASSDTQPQQASHHGRVLTNWDPEDPNRWDSGIAWTTLWVSTFSLIIGFSTWYLVSAVAPLLNQIGFSLSAGQLYWLTAIPGLACGIFRLIFMFLPPIIGTRKLVTLSSLLFIIPMVGWFFAVQDSSTSYGWLLTLAFLCGIGGGVFSGYMPSTGYFFPKSRSGTALGLQAGIGNFGMSLIQFLAPWVMGFGLLGLTFVAPQRTTAGDDIFVHNAAAVMIPWAILAAILAWTLLRDVPIKANIRQQIDIFGNKNTWILTIVYLMTFGAFSGFAAQFGLMINNLYGANSDFAATHDPATLPAGASFAFLGPLIGAGVRALWGPLCDRFGGAIWTFVGGVGMTISCAWATFYLNPTDPSQFRWFLTSMLVFFFFTGLGNAGTFKQMPMILPKRQAGGVIGWTGAIAAFGPFIVGVLLTAVTVPAFYWGCVVFFAIATSLVWIYYARPRAPFPG
ncbi:NarK/NasA family nitrate transporter [Corynebacterium uberis]|uniref:nitrate/nitrite transporter n=1 Tax=Corynebacterium TaxID=1716 RepID=UPI001D0BA160|nr:MULTISPECIES: nitrate/nitrite transporter [Corynebacterium]MCZ9309010.1 NarK/NasA family nitrate transporter [Corynebacterium sp. c6VSa_13]UDL74522.1 NarK/NasA family nitrate transporter [Corynebacterium uberis]UDL76644.1 NarK/NasA family nitrate transporter [Corynebacterium uberis]UDL78857.1 NarK/NasA family nitrate transporter [Corynebacterium uberis]UDL81135.1 NarK/NasA family nitrate transporter [Corynebacterium uberis]